MGQSRGHAQYLTYNLRRTKTLRGSRRSVARPFYSLQNRVELRSTEQMRTSAPTWLFSGAGSQINPVWLHSTFLIWRLPASAD